MNCELENEKNRPKSVYNVKHIIDNRAESVENDNNSPKNSTRSVNNLDASEMPPVENKPEYRVLGVAFKTYIPVSYTHLKPA